MKDENLHDIFTEEQWVEINRSQEAVTKKYLAIKATSPIRAVATMMAATSELVDKFIADEATGKTPVTCRKGCSHCCHLWVDTTEDEGRAIAYYCKEKNIPVDKEYLKKQLTVKKERLYQKSFSACVFLENNICRIYEARPLACRTHLVASPPEYCNSKTGSADNRLITTPIKADILSSVMHRLGGRTGSLPAMLLPFLP